MAFITLYTRGRARTTTSCIWYLYTYKQTLLRYFGSLAESVVLFAKPSCRGRHRRRLRPCHSRFSRSTRGLPYYSNISSVALFHFIDIGFPNFLNVITHRRNLVFVATVCSSGCSPIQYYWAVVSFITHCIII